MTAPACRDLHDVWGAGAGPADVEVAVAGCRTCGLLDGCVERYALSLNASQAEQVGVLVVGGLTGRDLKHAVATARRNAA